MIGWPLSIIGGAVAVAVQSSVSVGAVIIALSVLIVGGFALVRTKSMEAWKETASASALGRAEAVAIAEERSHSIQRERDRNAQLQADLDAEKKKRDLTPVTERLLEVLANDQRAETRAIAAESRAETDRSAAEDRHREMMVLLAQVAKNTEHS